MVRETSMEQQQERPNIGVAFSHMSCYGHTTTEQYQATFASYALAIPRYVGSLLSRRPAPKVQILRDLEGVVRPGEMLLVLGRPGSGCSTFLKTIAGDTRGFHIEDKAQISYQGMYKKKRKQTSSALLFYETSPAKAQNQASHMTRCSTR